MVLDDTLKQLNGWKYPLFVTRLFVKEAPELTETLVEHGVPRELIKVFNPNDPHGPALCDFMAGIRPNPNDYDEIGIYMIRAQVRDEQGRVNSQSLAEVLKVRIMHSDWYKRKGATFST